MESTGIEPVLTGCQPVVIPLYQDPRVERCQLNALTAELYS